MAGEQHLLSTEILNRGIEQSGPNAGTMTFSVRVRRRLPDFVNSVNLKYVKLGYHYLMNHWLYLATVPALFLVFGVEVGSLSTAEVWWRVWDSTAGYDLATVVAFLAVFVFTFSVYFMSQPCTIYLLDFACYKPVDDLKDSDEDSAISSDDEYVSFEDSATDEYEDYNHLFERLGDFDSRDEAYKRVQFVGMSHNIYFAIGSSIINQSYVNCDRHGEYMEWKTKEGVKSRKSSGSKKINCQFQLVIRKDKYSDRWYVRTNGHRGVHNHPLPAFKEGNRFVTQLRPE